MARLIGKPAINPFLYYSGKGAAFFLWTVFLVNLAGIRFLHIDYSVYNSVAAFVLTALGLTLISISLFDLGGSTSIGVPDEKTTLKIRGIYRLSRNPMYLGFHMITAATMVFLMHPIVIVLGIFSIYIYHRIILGEEKFLETRFGKIYKDYKMKVKRYF